MEIVNMTVALVIVGIAWFTLGRLLRAPAQQSFKVVPLSNASKPKGLNAQVEDPATGSGGGSR